MLTNSENELLSQAQLVAALHEGSGAQFTGKSVRLVETHISWVLLIGRYAYKIKKSLAFGFLDFTSLARRQFFCEEEIRLNHRLAPQIYLDVVPIGGTVEKPVLNASPAIEYAVLMRRFAANKEMDHLLRQGKITLAQVDQLATVLANFHMSLPPAQSDTRYGKGVALLELALENVKQLPEFTLDIVGQFVVSALQHAIHEEYAVCDKQIEQRARQGFVRECHGDLHLGNIVIIKGDVIPFDGIEFDPALRWIDIINDIAFPFMDFLHYKRTDLAYRFLNVWLELTGDYAGLAVLRFYASYRAAVRAKVNAIRAAQPMVSGSQRKEAQDAFRKYLAQACNHLVPSRPTLIITHGLPGSGKTTFSQAALERFGAVRIRSDVERKRLFGLATLESSRSGIGGDIYTSQATARTYDKLHDLAQELLKSGFCVIVDAAFLKSEEREQFRRLAIEMSAPFAIASIQASDTVLKARVEQRQRQHKDASEADLHVLEVLQASSKPLESDELARAVTFINDSAEGDLSYDNPGWNELENLIQ